MSAGDVVQLIAAIATVILAGGTFWMACETRRLAEHSKQEVIEIQRQAEAVTAHAEAANRQVEVSIQTLHASIQPWMTIVPRERIGNRFPFPAVFEDDERILISLHLQNAGSGIALIEPNTIELGPAERDTPADHSSRRGSASIGAIATGEQTVLTFELNKLRQDFPWRSIHEIANQDQHNGFLYISTWYSDTAGGQRTQIKVRMACTPKGSWRPHEITYRREPNGEPFATTRVSALDPEPEM